MSKTVTLRIGEGAYNMFNTLSQRENRSLSNFIETAALRYVEEHETVDEFEMQEILGNTELMSNLKQGHADAKEGNGRFV